MLNLKKRRPWAQGLKLVRQDVRDVVRLAHKKRESLGMLCSVDSSLNTPQTSPHLHSISLLSKLTLLETGFESAELHANFINTEIASNIFPINNHRHSFRQILYIHDP